MRLEKGIVTNRQLTYIIIAFMQSSALTVEFAFSYMKQSTWLAVLAGLVIVIPLALMYLAIAKRYPGKNLIQIDDAVFGPYLGKVLSAAYIWYFFQLSTHHMFFFNSFWMTYLMPETPRFVFLVMFGFVCAFAVRSGIEVIARCCFTVAVIVWITTITLVVLLLGDMKPGNLLPLFDTSLIDFIHSTHIMVTIPLGDLVLFLMIFPCTADREKMKKPVLTGIVLAGLQLLVIVLRDALVLGPRLASATSASFAAARQINIADVLTRMDILVAISLLAMIFIKGTLVYYVTVLQTAQLLGLRSYKPLVIPIGALIASIAVAVYPSDMEQVYGGKEAWPFNALLCILLLPAVTLAVIWIRSLRNLLGGKKEKEIEAQ